MASDKVLSAMWRELELLGRIEPEKLAEAVAGGKGFYGEGDIPLLEREK